MFANEKFSTNEKRVVGNTTTGYRGPLHDVCATGGGIGFYSPMFRMGRVQVNDFVLIYDGRYPIVVGSILYLHFPFLVFKEGKCHRCR